MTSKTDSHFTVSGNCGRKTVDEECKCSASTNRGESEKKPEESKTGRH